MDQPPCPVQCKSAKCPTYKIEKPIVWILGGPGSGKGTQCEKIVKTYGFLHLSTGDLLRAEIKSGSQRSKELAEIIKRGELAPNSVVLNLLKEAIQAVNASVNGYLIDGYPREKQQGAAFEHEIGPVSLIIYFEATDDTLMKRLLSRAAKSNRADDNIETIKIRLKTFHENNKHVLSQYSNKLVTIDSNDRSVDDIFADVQKALDTVIAVSKGKAARA